LRLLGLSAQGVNANLTASFAFPFELDNAVNLGEQGIVFTHPNVLSRMKLRAYLSHQNIPGPDMLATITLDTAPLGCTIPAVP
jgi:hypothetical protein